MSGPDAWMQSQLEAERHELTLFALDRISCGTATASDALFLAGELGLKNDFNRRHEHEQIESH